MPEDVEITTTEKSVSLTFGEAVNRALRRALEDDERVLVFGEDVGEPGGVHGITRGLRKRFGDRVFDTPISEAAILGTALGSSLFGMRPVAEIMWADFSLVALDQLVNQAANTRYVSAGKLYAPMTVRTQQGTTPGSCAQHSQSLEAFFAHVPGLRVCMPATVQDAYDLLSTAIRVDDPVIVIENRGLYFGEKQEITIGGQIAPMGGAARRHDGDDITIVTWGALVHSGVAAAEQLAQEGINADLIDLRWINPLDLDTILASVSRTGRVLVAHEANLTGGFGAELATQITSAAFHELRVPVARLGTPDIRMPAAPHLQAALLPDVNRIAQAAKDLVEAGTGVTV